MGSQSILNNIDQLYQSHILMWGASVMLHANYVMGILALIQVVWTIGWLTLKGQELDSIVATALKQILIIGFFYALVLNGGQWIPKVLNSFKGIGAEAGVIATLDPGSIMDQGLYVAYAVLKAGADIGFITHPFGAIMAVIVACVITFSYVLIAADLLVTLITAYCLIAVSSLFFAFGVSSLTSPMAKNLIQKSIAVGLKLMGIYVIVGTGTGLALTWSSYLTTSANTDTYYISWLSVAGATLIFWLLTKNIPAVLSSLAGAGSLMTHGSEVIGAAMAASTVAGSAVKRGYNAVAGAGKATVGAGQAGAGAAQTVYGAAQAAGGMATANHLSVTQGLANIASGINKARSGGKTAAGGVSQAVSGRNVKTL